MHRERRRSFIVSFRGRRDWNGVDRELSVVCGDGHDGWTRGVDRRCGARFVPAKCGNRRHDRRDAALILKLLMEGRFPRIWTPSGEEKDLRQLLIHRHKLVRIRVQVKNELQHLAMNQGVTQEAEVVEQGGREGAARVAAEAVGQPAARRPV